MSIDCDGENAMASVYMPICSACGTDMLQVPQPWLRVTVKHALSGGTRRLSCSEKCSAKIAAGDEVNLAAILEERKRTKTGGPQGE